MTRRTATGDLTEVQVTALQSLWNGDRVADVAALAGVDRRTVWRWQKLPAWRAFEGGLHADLAAQFRARRNQVLMAAFDAVEGALAENPAIAFKFIERFAGDVVAGVSGPPLDAAEIAAQDADRAANLQHQREERQQSREATQRLWGRQPGQIDADGWASLSAEAAQLLAEIEGSK